jgi:hypothetical protein
VTIILATTGFKPETTEKTNPYPKLLLLNTYKIVISYTQVVALPKENLYYDPPIT